MTEIGYPTWRYHATEAPRLIHSAEEEPGDDWADTPAAFDPPSVAEASDLVTPPKAKAKKKGAKADAD